jgi:uncharacterized protein
LITAATLNEQTRQDLAQMAKSQGIIGWHSMRKDELVRALLRKSRASASSKRASKHGSTNGSKNGSKNGTATAGRRTSSRVSDEAPVRSKASSASRSPAAEAETNGKHAKPKPRRTPQVVERIQQVQAERERLKDLSSINERARSVRKGGAPEKVNGGPRRDRIVLLVRDSYWLQVSWEIRRQSVERVRAAMGAYWHTARPVLRLIEVDTGATTSTAERVAREIEIHGGVANWYIDVHDPPKSYRVDIGYRADNGRFVALSRSNSVTTPSPGSSDALDQNWSDIAKDYERIYSLSGGYSDQPHSNDLKDLFEERLRRPMGTPMVTKFGVGADAASFRKPQFAFHVDAELIVYGQTRPDAYVTLAGQPVKLRSDGTFTVRRAMPERREVLPVVAGSGDGLEQRTVILAIERNTKIMEPVHREPTDQ